VIPLYIIMGHFTYHAGFVTEVFKAAQAWVGRVHGGVVQATIAGGTVFGAACGSGLASCAILAKITIPEMTRLGVDRKLAYGAVASVGPIAQMIPPSILMVIYGVIAGQSVGKLLIAGIFPGILAGVNFMIMVYIRAKRNPSLAPRVKGISWKESFISLKGVWGVGTLAVLMLGGIYTGVFTPTEAGAVGAFGAFVLSLALRRLSWRDLRECLAETSQTVGMVFLIVAGAFMFSIFLSISRLPAHVSDFLVGLEMPRLVILLGVLALYIALGFFMDMLAVLFITLPTIIPAILSLGYDPIWFGVLVVHTCEVGLITPPYGLNLFIIKGIVPNSKLSEIIAGVWPFFFVDMITLAMYIAFPQIALFLPERMMGG
jgi:C4-dicarboxylate transporter DctM subunit